MYSTQFLIENLCIIASLCAVLISLFLTNTIVKNALKFGWIDQPNERKMHLKTIPTMGGIAISLSTIILTLIFCELSKPMIILICSVILMTLIGAFDDKFELSAKFRLLIQVILSFILIYAFQWENILLGLVNLNFLPPFANTICSVLLIVAYINAFNFIDGIDGLSSSFAIICSLILIFGFIFIGNTQFAILFSIIAGATLGFYYFNFPPAKIFMGDSGSTVLGLLLASGAFELFRNIYTQADIYPSNYLAMLPFLIFIIPIFDLLRTLFFRKLRGESFLNPDKTHLHHLLIKTGLNHLHATLLIVLLQVALFLITILFSKYLSNVQLLIILISISVICTEGITIYHFLVNNKLYKQYANNFKYRSENNQYIKRNIK